MPTCRCGKEVGDYRAARGHVKFTDGERNGVDHGPKGEVSDDYRTLFEDDDPDPEPDQGDDDDPDEQPDEPDPEPDQGDDDQGDDQGGRLKRLFTTPVSELLGGE